jgi:hypothetical protein
MADTADRGMFTTVSLLRSYALRRLFEAMRGPRPH